MSFDRLAPHYRWMETLLAGTVLQQCRTRWLAEIPLPRRALLAGEGPGRMLEVCGRAWPRCDFTVLDASVGMIKEARRGWHREAGATRVNFIAADARDWPAPRGTFDLVVTNFFLDCFGPEDLKRIVGTLGRAAAPDATWLVNDFRLPPAGWRRLRARLVLGLAYGFFGAVTDISARRITAPDESLRAAGFVLQRRDEFNFGLLGADWWQRRDSRSDGDRASRFDS